MAYGMSGRIFHAPFISNHPEMKETPKPAKTEKAAVKKPEMTKLTLAESSMQGFNKLAGEMMGDAPPCSVCGNITIRSNNHPWLQR